MSANNKNQQRIAKAQKVLESYDVNVKALEKKDAVIDLLTDIRHWCKKNRVDFQEVNGIAAMHFRAEAQETSNFTSQA